MPFAVVDVTPDTVGITPSIIIFLPDPREPEDPGVGNVKIAAFAFESLIVPPFSASAVVLA